MLSGNVHIDYLKVQSQFLCYEKYLSRRANTGAVQFEDSLRRVRGVGGIEEERREVNERSTRLNPDGSNK